MAKRRLERQKARDAQLADREKAKKARLKAREERLAAQQEARAMWDQFKAAQAAHQEKP